MKIVKLVLYILFGLMFINAGLNKFFNYMPMPELTPAQLKFFTAFASISWLIPLVAAVEVIGGILVMIPKTRALGAIVLLPVMIGIFVHHLTVDPSGIVIAVALMAINILAIVDNWKKYEGLITD
ncbi:DoxX family membrane protein [Daejeonella lutea]|uniref:DoxX protein n=1 Tax=Daejeonella lutea TaxID=572036 RepID=A0A1T5AMG8_9SPHI|nr:DoxX family membrane protein [Daejeonella lutea]SKB36231.1 DoxX protein [Daejeonella lutea]